MNKKIYLLVGSPGVGKTWVSLQLQGKFHHIAHDDFFGPSNKGSGQSYVDAILEAAKNSEKPILIESPFSVSRVMDPLVAAGHEVVPTYIVEDRSVISERYRAREGREIPTGHLTRQETYAQRAQESGAFKGTSEEVLAHLSGQAGEETTDE